MLLSEVANRLLRERKRPMRITDAMLNLSCDRCGRTFPAETADIVREPAHVVYRCPRDGAELVRVGRGKFRRGGGDVSFHEGDAAIKIPGEEIPFMEFIHELVFGRNWDDPDA